MSERAQYDALATQSDAEYALAGIAMRKGDREAYNRHVDRAWAIMDEAKPLFDALPEAEQSEIRANAAAEMAIAFVKGLGRTTQPGKVK